MTRIAALAVLAIACGMALVAGLDTTRDLTWPGGQDFSRDIAASETIASGHPLSDQFYAGETLWYNPLVPATVAAVAKLAGAPIHTVYARFGAYLNLLAPVLFFTLCWRWFGPVAAMFAIAGFVVFVPGDATAILCATYSPWLLPVHTAQTLCYVALLALVWAWDAPTPARFALAGVALGVLFLAHTAPFLIVSAVAIVEFAPRGRNAARLCAPYFLTAAAASAAFWAPILVRYRFAVRNPRPMAWVMPELALENLDAFLRSRPLVSIVTIAIAIGLFMLIWRSPDRRARVTLSFGVIAALAVAYSYVQHYAGTRGLGLPVVVPAFHFLYYMGAVGAVAFGLAFASVVEALEAKFDRAGTWLAPTSAVVLGAALASAWPSYAARPDFVRERANARAMFTSAPLAEMYTWIRTATHRGDVFVAGNSLGLSVIATAGGRLVAVDGFFSNPYVDYESRRDARDAMLRMLAEGNRDGFLELARRYQVRYVALDAPLEKTDALGPSLYRVWSRENWTIYELAS